MRSDAPSQQIHGRARPDRLLAPGATRAGGAVALAVFAAGATRPLSAQSPAAVAGRVPAEPTAATSPSVASEAPWRWRGTVLEGGVLEVTFVRGHVRAEVAPGRQAEVALVRRGRQADPRSVTVAVDSSAGRVRLIDRYPRLAGRADGAPSHRECLPPDDGRGDFWHSDVRIDAVVRVPAGVRLVVRLMDGDVDVGALPGGWDAVTNSGAVSGEARRR